MQGEEFEVCILGFIVFFFLRSAIFPVSPYDRGEQSLHYYGKMVKHQSGVNFSG